MKHSARNLISRKLLTICFLSISLAHCASTEEEGATEELEDEEFSNESTANYAVNSNSEGQAANSDSEMDASDAPTNGAEVNNFEGDYEISENNLGKANNEGFNNLFNNGANSGIAGVNAGATNAAVNGAADATALNSESTNAAALTSNTEVTNTTSEVLDAAVNSTDDTADSELINAAMATTPVNGGIVATDGTATNGAAVNGAAVNATASVANAATTPVTNSATPAAGDRGKVRYVFNVADIFANPGNAAPIGQLERGDHPVVWDQGEFSKMGEGKFVPSKQLTDEPVGRDRKSGQWGMSSAH